MGVRTEAAARLKLGAEIFQLRRANAAFQESTGVNAGRRVALKINGVAFELLGARAEEMIEPNFEQCRRRSIGGNMAADSVLNTVGAHHHGQRVPAHQALDAPFDFLVARKQRLLA